MSNPFIRATAAPTPPDAGPGEIPAGMVAWHGGDRAPADWDRRYVLHRDGTISHAFRWVHTGRSSDIIAYTPKAPPQTPPDAGIGSDGAVLKRDLVETALDDLKWLLSEIERRHPGSYRATGTIRDIERALATQPGDGGRL